MERKPFRDPKREGPTGRAERKEGDRPEWQTRVARVKDVEKSPLIPSEITPEDLDMSVRVQLKTLTAENAEMVARHLAMVNLLIEDDPELAHKHALAASRRAGRLAIVHETLGVTAYAMGDFAFALRELLTHRRLSASSDQIPLIVDSERGMGRPQKALEAASTIDKSKLPVGVRINLAIALSGARLDLDQVKEAKQELEIAELSPKTVYPQSPLLFRSYAEVLRELGKDGDEWDALADRAEKALQIADGEVFNLIEEINIPSSEDIERSKQARFEKTKKYSDQRPRREFGDRPQRSEGGRPRRDSSDRPRRDFSDKPRREDGDRPRGDFKDRPRRESNSEARPERPYRERGSGSEERNARPARNSGERPRRTADSARPERKFSPRSSDSERGGGERSERKFSDRSQRKFSDKPRSSGSSFKPRGNRGKAD